MQVIACYGYDIMQIWKMGRKKLKFTRIEKNGQCLNECMELCLQNNHCHLFRNSDSVILVFKILSHCAFTLDDEPLDTIDAFTMNGKYMRVRLQVERYL